MEPKIFIGPMSKNVVDVVMQANKEFPVALIPSRRQIEANRGYVNNWDTINFRNYVKGSNPNIILCRDHAGPNQGPYDFNESLKVDCMTMDIIHIDPFKTVDTIKEAAEKTCLMIANCYKNNPRMQYEIGTEEAIFKYEPEDLQNFLSLVKQGTTPEEFSQIKYAVVQSGTGLDLPAGENTGMFDSDRLLRFIGIVKLWGLLSKEHNGDFLTIDNGIQRRFELGLDAINIAPEFGRLETSVLIREFMSTGRYDLLDRFYRFCRDSKKWDKWTAGRSLTIEEMTMAAGHYIFSTPEVKDLKSRIPEIDTIIRKHLKDRLYEIQQQAEKGSSNRLR